MADKEVMRRVSTRVSAEDYARVAYWADIHGESVSDYLRRAIETQIAFENHDYDLPAIEAQRLNQLVSMMEELIRSNESLANIINSGFESLLGLTRGDSYLNSYDGDDVL